ncbi:glycosyltransferase [Patescibacteria group bacterium]|nr:glycosyltransferase [Patescibacteria group bacterium]
MDKISVIIPTKDRIQDVVRCLESLLTQAVPPDEILIVDGSDTKKLNSEIKLCFTGNERIKYVHSKPGLTLQRNVGISASSGDIIVFIDDDVVLEKNCLKEIMYVFNTYPRDIGGVTANIAERHQVESSLHFSDKIRDATVSQFLLSIFFLPRWGDGKFQLSGFPTFIKSGAVDEITFCEFLFGYCMAFRKEILDEFRFNENLYKYRYAEDDEFAYRLSRKYRNVYVPYAKGIHNYSSAERSLYDRRKGLMINHLCYFKKNLPQDLKHNLAFYWSVVGLFLMEAVMSIVRKDSGSLRGLWAGMREASKI